MIYIATADIANFFMAFMVKVIAPDTRDFFIGFEKVYCQGYRLNNKLSSLKCI